MEVLFLVLLAMIILEILTILFYKTKFKKIIYWFCGIISLIFVTISFVYKDGYGRELRFWLYALYFAYHMSICYFIEKFLEKRKMEGNNGNGKNV